MSQNSNISENQNEEASQTFSHHNFVHLSNQNQQPHEHHYPDVQTLSDPFMSSQHDMYFAPRPMCNFAPELSFGTNHNLPQMEYNINSNRDVILSRGHPRTRANYRRGRMPRLCRGSSSRLGREAVAREYMETNHQYSNVRQSIYTPWNSQPTPIRNSLYDSSYAENGQPVDPFLRLMQLNPNFGNSRDNK